MVGFTVAVRWLWAPPPPKVAVDRHGVRAQLVVDDLDGGVGRFAANAHEIQVGQVLGDLLNSCHGWGLVG